MNPENENNEVKPITPSMNGIEPPKAEENPYAIKWGAEENTPTPSISEEASVPVPSVETTPVVNTTSTAPSEVVPIAPAFEAPTIETPAPVVGNSSPGTEPQPDPKEEKKKNRNLILLGIFFVALLLFVYFLPDITAFIAEKKAEQDEKPVASESPSPSPSLTPGASPSVKNGKLTCTGIPVISADQSVTTTLVTEVNYTDEKVQEVVVTEVHDYKAKNPQYEQSVQNCASQVVRYNDSPGYHAECSIQENQIKIVQKYSLKTFQPINDLENNVTITSSILFNTNLKEVQKQLESGGNTCK